MAHSSSALLDVHSTECFPASEQQLAGSGLLVVIDPSVQDYEHLAAGVLEGAEVVVLRDDVDAIAQITEVLRTTQRRFQSLHLVTHGAPGRLQFSTGELSLNTLAEYPSQLAQWSHYLASDASLLLYGCQLASGDVGTLLLRKLHLLSNLSVAAATQNVGCPLFDGTWQLAHRIDQPESTLAFSLATQKTYPHVLVLTSVVSITPTANDNNAPLDSNISIIFDTAIDGATVNASTIKIIGDVTGEITGAFTVVGTEVLFNPGSDFQPGEQIEVVVTSGVQSADSTPVIAYNHRFLSATSLTSGAFSSAIPVSTDADLNYAVALSDLDNDGDIDAFVIADLLPNKVLLNNGDGTFTPTTNSPSNNSDSSFGVDLGDLDGDGDVDAVVANLGTSNQVLLNDGAGDFSSAVIQLGDSDFSASVSLGDLDNDGDLDAFIANYGASTLLINDGTGQFTSSTLNFGSNSSNDVDLGDLDGDGDLDAFIANNGEADTILINDGSANFTATNLSLVENSFFVELGDLDGDGDLDAFVTVDRAADKIWFNDGSGGFSLATTQPPTNLSSYGATLVDIDGDSDLDAFVANYDSSENSQLLLNNGSGVFSLSSTPPGTEGVGNMNAQAADLNGNGTVDLFVVNDAAVNQVFLNGGSISLNAAPTFTGGALLVAVNEGDPDPSGETISNLFLGQFQDEDSGSSLSGVAVVANAADVETQGNWQYSLDGVSWQSIATTVNDASALALSESTKVRFLPVVGYNGMPPSLNVRALDNTYSDGFSTNSAAELIDASANGGSSAISGTANAIATTVNPIANVVFVNQDATGSDDGSSWENAYTDLQSALAIASDGDEIWLAQGTYTPGTTREATFDIAGEISIYGGFVGGEASRSARDFQTNLTILSGEIGAAGNSDNSYHVVTGNSLAGALIDGVIIQDGNTQGAATDADDDGGGVYNKEKLTLKNVVVRNNTASDDGGGIRNDGDLTVVNSTIADNVALSNSSSTSGGGGLINTLGSSATLVGTTFSGNQAKAGGAIRNDGQMTLVNTTLSGNLASESGGGLINTTSDPLNPFAVSATVILINSTITNNEDQNSSGQNFNGAGVANFGSLTTKNSIIAGNNNNDDIRNHFVGNSLSEGNNIIGNGGSISGFTNGTNNDFVGSEISPVDPLLGALQDNGGFTQTHVPTSNSVAIDGGNNSSVALDTADLDGDSNTTETVPFGQRGAGFSRINGTVDIGAVESLTGPNTAPSLTGDGVLAAVDEDTADPAGETLATLLSAQFVDPDVGAVLRGVAVVANASGAEGDWQYSTDGTTWLAVGVVADDATALALDANTLVRFVPAADYNGAAPVLTIRALDDTYSGEVTSGATRRFVDTTNNGGRSAIAQTTNAITTSITAVNDAPVLATTGLQLNAVDEDAATPVGAVGTLVSELIGLASEAGGLDNVTDVDAGALTGIAITTADISNGEWFYSLDGGASWLNLGAVAADRARLLAADARVYFQPTADFNDSISEAIRFRAWDQSTGVNGDFADVSINGGVTAFSVAVEAAGITVNAVNDAPTVALQNVLASLAENANTAGRIKVADIVVSDIDAGTNNLALTGTDAALFEIDGTELYLKAGTALDFESRPQLDVSVEVDDSDVGATPDDTAVLSLAIVDVNEAPSAIALVSPITTIAEDADTSTPQKLADISITDDALGANSLSVVGPDAALFEIVNTELFLKAGTVLDFEGQSQYNISVQVDDAGVGASPDATVNFALAVTDVNEAPSAVSLLNAIASINESADTTVPLKVADISLTDDALGTNVLSVSGADAANFEIVGDALFLKANTPLDFETKSQYDVVVQVDDASVGTVPDASTATLSISVGDVNEAPSAIALSNTTSTLNENTDTSVAIKIADIDVTDDIDVSNNTLSLSGADAADFEIVGTELRLKAGASLDFETKTQYDVTVQVDDATVGASPDATVDFTLSVADVNEAPTGVTLQNEQVSLVENVDTTSRLRVADIAIADDALGSNTLTVTGTDAAFFEVVGAQLFLKAGTVLDFESKAQYDVTVAVDDTAVGVTPDTTVDFSIAITDVNEAPTAIVFTSVVSAVAENTNTSSAVKLADISVTDDALGSNALRVSGADAALFEIIDNELFLTAGTVLDTEFQNQYNVVVEADDAAVGSTPDALAIFSLDVTDVNEAPTGIVLENVVTTLGETLDTTSSIKVADIQVADDAIGVNTLTVAGPDASAFEIVGNALFLKAGTDLDFENKPQYDVVVQVDDAGVGATPDVTVDFSLLVADVNEAPTALSLLNATTALDETTDTSSPLKLADISITDDALGSNGLSLTGADAGAFEIVANELFLKAGTSLDFESKPQYDVVVQVDDAGVGVTPDAQVNFSLSVGDVNEAPSAIALSTPTLTLSEDVDTSSPTKVADIDVSDDAKGTNTLSLSGLDAANFALVGNELFLKAGTSLDFENKAQYDVSVQVDDASVGTTPDAVADFTLVVGDANEAPTGVLLENVITSLPEDRDTAVPIKLADVVVADDALGSNTLTLAGADAAAFEIVGTALFLKAGISLDLETKATYDITVQVDDVTVGNTVPAAAVGFTLALTDVNEAPTAVTFENAVLTLAENINTATGVKLADIVVADDALGSNSLSVVGPDADLFEVVGNALFLKAGTPLDLESKEQYDIVVQVDDASVGSAPDASATFTLLVTDVNEAPTSVTFSNAISSINEIPDNGVSDSASATAASIKLADINVADDSIGFNTLSLTGADANSFEIAGDELRLKAGTVLDFESKPRFDIVVQVDDATMGNTPDALANFGLDVVDLNEAPNTLALQNPVVNLDENADTTERLKLAEITFLDDALGANILSVSGRDAGLFELEGADLFLKAGSVLDFEAQNQYDVSVTIDDAAVGQSPDDSVNYSLSLSDVNEAPTAVNLSNVISALGEDADTSSRIKVADITVTDDALGSMALRLTGSDAASFELSSGVASGVASGAEGVELFLKAGVVLDFEAKEQFDVNVVVDDVTVGASEDAIAPLTLAILDVNELPSAVVLQSTVSTLDENVDTTARVKLADIVIADDALGTNTLSVTGTDAADFEIVGNALFLKAGTLLDFETKSQYDVTVEVNDAGLGGAVDVSTPFSLTVNNLNEAPSAVTFQNVASVIAEDIDITNRVKIADIQIADDALGSNALTLAGADASDFEIAGGTLFLRAGTSLNSLIKDRYDVVVQADDPAVEGTPDVTASFSLEIAETNDAPTGIELQNVVPTLAEDTDTSNRIALGDIVVIDDTVGFNTLSLVGVDAAAFEIDAGQLFFKAGNLLDFEAKAAYSIGFEVDDPTLGSSPDAVTSFSLAVGDVNEAPTAIGFSNALSSLRENADTTGPRQVAIIEITDDALGTNTFGLTGADAADFEIFESALFFKAGTVLDFETKNRYDVSLVVGDDVVGTDSEVSIDFSLDIEDVNEAPTGLALSAATASFAESFDTERRTKLADIEVSDDRLGNNSLRIIGDDASLFEIDGAELFLKAGVSLDHESQAKYDIVVTVDDASVGSSPDATANFSLSVTDVNEAPSAVTIQSVVTTLDENTSLSAPAKVADVVIADDALGTNVLSLSGQDAAVFELVNRELFLKAGTPLNFENQGRYDVTVQVDDSAVRGAVDASADFSLAVKDVNEAPSGLSLPTAVAAIAENTDTTNRIKLTDILITDDALGNNTLTVVGVDADIFEIVGTELFLKAGSVLDKSVKDQYSITVEVNDASFGSAPNGQATFVLDIAETNDAPTAVSLQNVLPSIAENADTQSALKVADIVVADDPVGINSFKVVGADAGLFETVGSELFLSAGVALNFESKARYDATLQVDDVSVGGSPDAVVNFSLTVDNVNEAPVLLNNTLTIVKGGTVVLSGQNLAATDVDNNNAALTYVVSQVSGGRFERVGETTTALTNFTQAQIDNGEIQFVHDDSDDAPSYVVSVSDGALSSVPQTVTIERFTRPGEGPTNVVPIAQGTDENRSLFFSASTGNRLAVENFGSSNDLAVKLSVDSGFLTLGDLDALSFVVGDGKDDRTLEFAGALADINSALNGLVLTPERGYTGSINLQIVSEDQGLGAAFADTDTIAVEVSPGKAPSALAIENNQLVSVVGGSGGSQLTLSLESVDSEQVNEIIVAETDAQGRIDGLAPGQDGYFAVLVARSRVVFSTLTEGFNGLSIDRTLDVLGDTSLQFAVIQGGSLDQVRQGQTHRIRLASPLPDEGSVTLSGSALQAQQLSDRSLKLGFELEGQRGFDDIVLRAVLEDAIAPTGSNLQGDAADSELLDLRGIVGPVAATFEVYREAAFDNVVGFFTVENEAGQVLDGQGNLLTVGDAGYIAAAMSNRVAVNLTAQNNQMSTYTAELTGGQLLSSFIISNGSVESLLDGDAGNDPAVYFTHIGANSDRADHVRLLGDNTFGFEDLANGGDQDFNDIVVKVKL